MNTRLAVLTVPSAVLELNIGIVTLAFGAESNTTVKLAVNPDSAVISPIVGFTVMLPGVSEAELAEDLRNLRRYERNAILAMS